MNKNETNGAITAGQKRFYLGSLRSLILFSLILPLALKLLVDIPSIPIDYICNSYAPFYPGATTAGLVTIQVVAVIADILRAGFLGCVICIFLHMIDKNVGKARVYISFAVTIVCPALISGLGIYLTKLCVSTGLSRQTEAEFNATLSDIKMSAMIEFALYAVVIVGAILCLLLRKNSRRNRSDEQAEKENKEQSFFPSTTLFGSVALSIGLSGAISLVEKVLETVVELQTYQVLESFEGVVSYLVLPYLYLAVSLFAMLCFAAVMYRRMDKKWKKSMEEEE